jgi:hypothetical protein
MIISAPDIPAVAFLEAEQKPVLLIHSNTVKTVQIASQPFQVV